MFRVAHLLSLILLVCLWTPSGAFGQLSVTPSIDTVCYSGNSQLSSNSFSGFTYQWQDSSSSGWSNLSNTGYYQGVSSDTLNISGADSTLNGRKYRCVIDSAGSAGSFDTSNSVLLIVLNALSKPVIDSSQSICSNTIPDTLKRTALAAGADGIFSYQWQQSSNGSTWSNIAGQTSANYRPNALTNSTYFRLLATT